MAGPIIWCEGIIGAGKSTLTQRIADDLNLRPLYEPVETNPYLEGFYKDPGRFAFPMQVELLQRRYAMQKLAAFETTYEGGFQGAVLDRGLPGDRVFARMLTEDGHISELEWATYQRLYDVMTCSLIPPSLLVFLDADPRVAWERIKARSRGAEAGIQLSYLRRLQRGYLDLMVEIRSGAHSWSRGMDILHVPWNVDWGDVDNILAEIRHRLRV